MNTRKDEKIMNISFKRNKLHVMSNNLLEIESTNILGWTPNFTKGYASFSKCIDSINALLQQLDYKPNATDEVKAWYKANNNRRKKALKIQQGNYDFPIFNSNKELKDYQKQAISYFYNMRNCVIGYDMGLGKVQPITEPVLTKEGWRAIGELNINDEIYNSEGSLSKVSGIFPQGTIKNYEVIFSDGSKTYCGEDHLWTVQTTNLRARTPDKYIVKSLKELIHEGIRDKKWHKRDQRYYYNNKWFIPIIKPIQWESKDHIIHPYNLGLLLNNNNLTNNIILHNIDKEIQNKFIKLANCKVNLNEKPYRAELERLGLWKKTSGFKFIPDEYLFDSVENRIQLLQGLMDTGGTIHNSNYSYSTKSLELANNLRHLVQSLGGVSRVSRVNDRIIKGETYYNVNVQTPKDITPFTTQYHLNRYVVKNKYRPTRAIKEVNYIGECEGVCIKTNAKDHLYITRDFILTHNTLISLNCIKSIKAKKVLIVCPTYLKYNWVDEILKWTPEISYQVIEGTPDKRDKQFKNYQDGNKNVLIINYEQVKVKIKKNGKFVSTNAHPYLQNNKFDLIIWDEAHRLKTRSSQNSCGAFALQSTNKLMLTGTPITKNSGEIYRLLNILDRERFTSYWTFVKHFMYVSEGFRGLEIGHLIKPKQFKNILNQYMIRKLKQDVADLPEKTYIEIPVYMSAKQNRYYKLALEEYLNPNESVIESDVERFIRMCQIAQNPVILDGEDVSIVRDTVLDIIDDKPNRIMIGCTYIGMSENLVESIKKKYPKRNVYLNNSMTKNRHELVDKFKKDDTSILVTTIKCLAEGANLDCCDDIVFADIEWNCGVNGQFKDRIHRMTSTRIKNYYYIIVKNSILDYKYAKIEKEANMAKVALSDSDQKIIRTLMDDFKKEMISNGK